LKDYNINKKELYDNCVVLSNLRKQIAEIFSESIVNELKDLGMNKAQFRVSFNAVPAEDEFKCESQNGFDVIEFEFSANAGEPLKPLSMVISGGEMSRFMLSIKSQTAKYNEIGTFIFDEIDAGISGNVAKIVAEKFANISKNVQLIAITHLPQISAMADNNLLIEKFDIEDKTLTKVKTLNEEEKVLEIVRLVGGSKDSLTSIEHAKELIVGANNYKKKILN
jgi:DNA repair protein RecN (Recombination protein N)